MDMLATMLPLLHAIFCSTYFRFSVMGHDMISNSRVWCLGYGVMMMMPWDEQTFRINGLLWMESPHKRTRYAQLWCSLWYGGLSKLLNKQMSGRWFEPPWPCLIHHPFQRRQMNVSASNFPGQSTIRSTLGSHKKRKANHTMQRSGSMCLFSIYSWARFPPIRKSIVYRKVFSHWLKPCPTIIENGP